MKQVLCYGDSNTWGYATEPRPDLRYSEDERWPGIMAGALGAGFRVIEEGLPGRTTCHDDPTEGAWMNGASYLMPCLRTHRPLDLVVIMLGTNDLKYKYNVGPYDIAEGVGALLKIVKQAECGRDGGVPKMLAVAPPPLHPSHGTFADFALMFSGGDEKSKGLGGQIARVAAEYGAEFLDAGKLIVTSPYDGVHFDPPEHVKLAGAIGAKVRAMLE